MRDLVLFPITTEEILEVLGKFFALEVAKMLDPDAPEGDITGAVLAEAITRIRAGDDWWVHRQLDCGPIVPVREGLSEASAKALYDLLTERGHKQTYFLGQKSQDKS